MDVIHPDLFGGETRVAPRPRSPYQRWRVEHQYRDAAGGANCSSCVFSFRRSVNLRAYRKCLLLGCSHSQSTDVSRRKVCNSYKARESERETGFLRHR